MNLKEVLEARREEASQESDRYKQVARDNTWEPELYDEAMYAHEYHNGRYRAFTEVLQLLGQGHED